MVAGGYDVMKAGFIMNVNISSQPLPTIYKRNGKECYLDPIRKKLIYVTPEETVRQRVISYLLNDLNVPIEMISVEEHLSHYGITTKKRADIVIHGTDNENKLFPVCVVECKAEDVYLDDNTINQALTYCDLIDSEYATITNGIEQICFKYDSEISQYISIATVPTYIEMMQGEYTEVEECELPPRIPFDDIESFLRTEFSNYEDGFYGYDISSKTPMCLAIPMFNFLEALLDTRIKMPKGNYGLFELIEDYGVRIVTYGNGSGGKFFGPYRSFLVNVNGNTEFYSIAVTTYSKSTSPENVKTCICVAHDDEKTAHHALQLVADDNITIIDDKVTFYHHGKIAIGRSGSGKIEELRNFVSKRFPQVLEGNRFNLGQLSNDRLWKLDDEDVINVVSNMISYAIVRDEYRTFVKRKKQ